MRGRLPTVKQVLQTLALLAVAVLVGAPVAYSTFVHSERHVVIGAHDATVVPVLDGYATIDFGPLLPQMRLPADAVAGIGVDISLGNAEVESLDQLVARDAVIASQPEGEIAAVRSAVRDMLEAALLRGVGVGVLVAIGVALTWVAIGPARRAQFRRASRRPSRPQVLMASFVGVLVVASTVLVALPEQGQGRPATSWVPLVQAFPDVPERPGARPGRDRQRLGHRGQQGAGARRAGDLPRLGRVLRRARPAGRDHERPAAEVGRDHGARRHRPSRQHRHGSGRPGHRRPGSREAPDRSRRRHVERGHLGDVQHQLAGARVPRLPDRRGRRQPRPGLQRRRHHEGPWVPGAGRTPRRHRRHPVPRIERPTELRARRRVRRRRGRQHRGHRQAGPRASRRSPAATGVCRCWWSTARHRPRRRPRADASTSCCPATCTARWARR